MRNGKLNFRTTVTPQHRLNIGKLGIPLFNLVAVPTILATVAMTARGVTRYTVRQTTGALGAATVSVTGAAHAGYPYLAAMMAARPNAYGLESLATSV